jgi:Tol biopolymer transport system component
MNDNQTVLESWKEIAAYLQRDITTVRRWEKREVLPVHRHTHESRASVYAYPSEIDAWRAGRGVASEPTPELFWRWPALTATMLLCLVMAGNGIRPETASAQQSTGKAVRQVWVTRPSEEPGYQTPFSADGRYAAYTDWETGDLGVRDLLNGTNRLLTQANRGGDYAESPIFSSDSSRIAYTWFDSKEHRNELRVIPREGGNPRALFSSTASTDEYVQPRAWTPDGKRLLVVHTLADRTSRLAMLSIEDGSINPIKSIGWLRPQATLSPDGRYIAYDLPAGGDNQARDIFVLATDGSQEAKIVENPGNDELPLWSPDGSQIVFFTDRTGSYSLWTVPVKDGKPAGPAEMVKPEIGQFSTAGMTRGGVLYYVRSGLANPNIYSAGLGPDMRIAKAPELAVDTFVDANNGPAISPDGAHLAYISFRPGPQEPALIVRTLATGEEHTVPAKTPHRMIFGYGPMWFPDGRSVLVLSRDGQRPAVSFHRVEVDSGDSRLLHRTAERIQGYKLSPGGKTLFFTEVTGQSKPTTRLVRFDLDSGREQELRSAAWHIAVAVSPDSRQLAFLVQDDDGSSYLAIMPAAGGEAREVYRGAAWDDRSRYNTLAWTPDQRYLMFVRGSSENGPNVLWRVPAAGGRAEEMGLSMVARIHSPQIHPDGKRIFFSANANYPNEVWALENFLPKAAK